MRLRAVVVAAAVAAAVLAPLVLAATLLGTAGADVLTGGPGADRIYGRGGNDRLSGRGGNDLLVGGAGRDTIACGTGRDTVQADALDRVARDCEVVKRPRPVAPTPDPPVTPEPIADVRVGRYCGSTDQGRRVCFTVGRELVSSGQFYWIPSCTPPSPEHVDALIDGSTPLAADGTFRFTIEGGDLSGTVIDGRIASDGTATGTMRMRAAFPDRSCAGTIRFTTRLG